MKLLFGLATLASAAFADITLNVVGYSYLELSSSGAPVKSEGFIRKHQDPAKDTQTLNGFFEHPQTVWELPKIPYTYTYLVTYPSKTKAFKHKQIAELNANSYSGKDYRVSFRVVNSKTCHSVHNVTFKTSGKSSKQAFKFKFDTDYNQTFFSRPNIKLRSMVMDPTMMREKLYIDMLNSAGIPTQQGARVRLFVNNEPYGLYLMVDGIKKSFLEQTVYDGNGKIERGSFTNYIYENLGNYPLKELIDLMRDLNSFNPISTPNPIQHWNDTRIDFDGILRNMALEYLGGAFDNYWVSASNYFMYKNPTLGLAGKWQWLPTDFDSTFDNGAPTFKVPTYCNWYDFVSDDPERVGRQALKPRIEMYNQTLSVDAKWDYSLTRKSPGINNNLTFVEFSNNFHIRTKDLTPLLFGWVEVVSNLVASDLRFSISATMEDCAPLLPGATARAVLTTTTAMMKRMTWTALPPRLATAVLVN
ncbi:hypothetical protein BG000_004946 [Podila horticola]|nr:hypothetical protein BG000_004946 [Podila horticola]